MQEMHLHKPSFAYSAFTPFIESIARAKNLKKNGNMKDICWNKLEEISIQHYLTYGNIETKRI